jgi:hypothetical protein
MTPRNQWSSQERQARSRLAQILHDQELIRGSVVTMARTCGKARCRCLQGEKHESLYLSVVLDGKRRMVYIPPELEDEVRQRVTAYREVETLTETVSAACVDRVLTRKAQRKETTA